jgi:hypothetical protein
MFIQQWRATINAYFPDLQLSAEILLSVICQLRIKDIKTPFGLVLIDVPSSGKTIALNFLTGKKDLIYVTDNFTASSFVSHAANQSAEKLNDIDLLPKIKNKTFIVRDLAPIFGMRDDDILKTMGILTRVFDGEGFTSESGLHGQRGYTGKFLFMFIAASTPIQPRVWKVMGNFGSRLFFYYLNSRTKKVDELTSQVCDELSFGVKQAKCRKATNQLLDQIFEPQELIIWDRKNDNKELVQEIAIISKLLACLRGTINVWKDHIDESIYNHTTPQVEKPDRIMQAFYNFARGHAVACERGRINDEDVAFVLKVALSSASLERIKFFDLLIRFNGEISTEEAEDELGFSKPTVLKTMKIFEYLEIAKQKSPEIYKVGNPERIIKLKEEFSWFLSPRFKKLKGLL